MSKKNPGGPKLLNKTVELIHVYPENLQSHYVPNLIVQHDQGVFILSFFETWPPVIIGKSDEEKQKWPDRIDRVESKCVARLVVTPDKMAAFITAMSENLDNYNTTAQTKKIMDEEDNS